MRLFGHEDMGEILEIEKHAFPKTPYTREMLLYYAGVFPDTFVVACAGEGVVGYIIFDPDGHVISTAVKAGHRRKGVGRGLIMHAMNRAEARLWLEVRSKNRGAIAFYRSLGMEIVGRMPGYYGSDDAYIMTKGKGGKWEKRRILNAPPVP